jgi:hypothetical protein
VGAPVELFNPLCFSASFSKGVLGLHDAIVAVNGAPLRAVRDPRNLPALIAPLPRPLRMTFLRSVSGEERRASVSAGEHAAAVAHAEAVAEAVARAKAQAAWAARLLQRPEGAASPAELGDLLALLRQQDSQLRQQASALKVTNWSILNCALECRAFYSFCKENKKL